MDMAPNSHTMPFELQAADTDFARRWKPASILSYMQILADRHADMLRCSQNDIGPLGRAWVIARVRIDMERYPAYGDRIFVSTWPGDPDRLTFPRYFRFSDDSGHAFGRATSRYMMIDTASREFIKPAATDIYRMVESLCPDENPQPERIRLKTPARSAACRAPLYSDIDMNGHMNNARYAEWICDLFPTGRFLQSAFKKFQINYVSDGIEGHPAALEIGEDAGGFIARGTDQDTGKIVFESAGEWMDAPPRA